jgi:hypothetical protein
MKVQGANGNILDIDRRTGKDVVLLIHVEPLGAHLLGARQ